MSGEKERTSIFIFHRALRIDDNTGLITALKNSEHVIPVFIFTPEQITDKNKFRPIPSVRFMIDALNDLNSQLKEYGSKLYIFYGEQHEVMDSILRKNKTKLKIDALYVNMDYTPYALKREEDLVEVCQKHNISMYSTEDYLLLPINTVTLSDSSEPAPRGSDFYSKYTPYYRKAVKKNVPKPISNRNKNFFSSRNSIAGSIELESILKKIPLKMKLGDVGLPDFPATREEGLSRIKNLKNFKNYGDTRNTLSIDTTRLSPYLKFGVVSPREVYHRVLELYGKKHTLIAQLIWRDFYCNIGYNRPDLMKGASFKAKYDKIKWNVNKQLLKKWEDGETGIPIVDAGMRELVGSGFMHNRTRLITSNFLVKHLFIDWHHGEKIYSKYLVDFDPLVNNGNWQWTAGSGADSQQYFRIMNPWLQSKKYDPDCTYIKKWIPELKDVPIEDIHDWQNSHQKYTEVKYPAPCIDYDFNKLKKQIKKIYGKIY